MKLVGASPHAVKIASQELPSIVNYFRGSDSTKWRTNIHTYASVKYLSVYKGVDLVYYGNPGRLEYDFLIAPEADPKSIELQFDGFEKLDINAQGEILLQPAAGPAVQLHKPLVYQDIDGQRRKVPGAYAVRGDKVSFQLGAYDRGAPLVIDPVLAFSTYLGGGNDEAGWAIAMGPEGDIYVTGDTNATDFPLVNAFKQSAGGDTDVFVTKLSANGRKLLYSTYLGGSGADVGYGIAVDQAGNAYVTGDTSSADFPVANPLQSTLGGAPDAFVAKLSADGSKLLYSTYIGGSNGERGNGIAVDSAGNAYVAGYTHSKNFPTANALQQAFAGGNADAFVLKINPNGSSFIYSTYLGGGNDRPDIATAIAVDSTGNAYVTGFTNSRDFPTMKPMQAFVGPTDVFVTKLNSTGSALIYSTFLGGRADEEAMGIAVDASGSAYVTGETESPNFPTTAGAYSRTCATTPVPGSVGKICAGGDLFVSKLRPDGSGLVYSTYVNASGFEVGRAIAVDSEGNAYVTGITSSRDFPLVNPIDKTFGGQGWGALDAFVLKLNASGSSPIYSTYLGGSGDDAGYGIALDRAGNAYVTGYTESRDFPTRNRLRHGSGDTSDKFRHIFVAKISDQGTLSSPDE